MKNNSKKEPPHMFKEIDEIFASHGTLSEGLISYTLRPGQIDMAYLVAEALEDNRLLVVEAGTGTGKTLAYLVPSILWAASNDERVVISTNTINLQDQIWNKDIPILQELLPYDFRAVRIKGRSNYLCLQKWSLGFQLTLEDVQGREFLDKMDNWLHSTRTGDKSELNLSSFEDTLWRRYSADDYSCKGSRCRCASDCFLRRARSGAAKAHIILVNHSLLLTDAAGGFGILPEFSKLVVDEAHNLSANAVSQFSLSLEQGEMLELYNLLGQFAEKLKSKAVGGSYESIQEQLEVIIEERSHFFRLFSEMFGQAEGFFQKTSNGKLQVRIRKLQDGDYREAMEKQCSSTVKCLSGIETTLRDSFDSGEENQETGILEEINYVLSSLKKKLTELCNQDMDEYVFWIERHGKGVVFHTAPLYTGNLLSDVLYSRLDSMVLTSGTLRLNNSFDYFIQELGLSDFEDVIYEKVRPAFDLTNQARILIADELPSPNWEQDTIYMEACSQAIHEISRVCTGNLLALFTSHRHLLQTYELLKEPLEGEGMRVLAHDIDGDRYHLVDALKSGGKTLLLGTGSFWEGIDIQGDSLQCVIITKLPFPVPDSPLLEAKVELYKKRGCNPFAGIFLPVCTTKLLQGIGRLIRSESDFGFAVILDSRLTAKAYGRFILESLPEVPVLTGDVGFICDAIEETAAARNL